MKIYKYPDNSEVEKIIKRPIQDIDDIREKVIPIINSVVDKGDKALIDFTKKFDGVELQSLKVDDSEFKEAELKISQELKDAIEIASQNIYQFHSSQKLDVKKITVSEGIICWRKSVPIERVGLYIPGGTSPLFSSLLMLGIPAKIAGCKEIIVTTPPLKNGKVSPYILYTANVLGITNVYKVGGAQAIAAMAKGTDSIPKVDKIFGPGNQWVTAAKQYVNSIGTAIDMPAGPSEVLVIADESADPKFVATDLLSQAEHGSDSQVILITTSNDLINSVQLEIESFTKLLPRKEFIQNSLSNSMIILVDTIDDAMSISNKYAPEHLILSVNNAEVIAENVINAGSVFLGNYSPESAGDYASGTNHTLPTNGYASVYSGVSLDSFMKNITFQKLTKSGLASIGNTIELMAESEGLDAHKLAVSIRMEKSDD
ncbi:MAG: histidinol dehydrogenase [Bacteroidota bacterium]